MAGHDDQQHAQRHHDDIAVLQDDVGQVDRLEQHAIGKILEEQHDQDQRQQQAIVAHIGLERAPHAEFLDLDLFAGRGDARLGGFCGHDAFPSARTIERMIFSWLASLVAISPTMRPSFIT